VKIIADLHIHSRFSRACSPQLTLSNLDKWGAIKGVNLLTVGDFTHPVWIKECQEQLKPEGNGFYQLKNNSQGTHFLFTTEISFIYKKADKVRRVHEVVLSPDLETAQKINQALTKRNFNLKSDGRPILGLSDRDFLELMKNIDARIEIIPAHIWTPWFSVFGSKSGFDSLEECFADMTKYIFALETGLSSDPPMNWRVSSLDPYILVSNSDSHSLKNIGREANVFSIEENKFSYQELIRILKEKDIKKFLYTIEFFPEEGKYHFDGHRNCGVVFKPSQTIKNKGICPVCKKPLTLGVSYRVEELADRPEGYSPTNKPGYKRLIELDKIIAEVKGVKSRESIQVKKIYQQMTTEIGNEISILTEIPLKQLIQQGVEERIVQAIAKVREEDLFVHPGYDGLYGEVNIFAQQKNSQSEKTPRGQKSIFN
jgi:uncharacterized protein (TIGR00375 family)